MSATVSEIVRYPVKGLSPQVLDQVALAQGIAMPHDRRFAVALGSTPVDGAKAAWQAKTRFLALVRNEKLAALESRYDEATSTLTLFRRGKQVARGKLTDRIGRTMIEDFLAAYFGDEARGRPKIVERAGGGAMTDMEDAFVSIIGLGSLKDLERVTGGTVHRHRFRANLYLDGLSPWEEFGWVGRDIRVGDAVLEVVERINRCAAVDVDPETATRAGNLLGHLQRGFGHTATGVYARIKTAGPVATGDAAGTVY